MSETMYRTIRLPKPLVDKVQEEIEGSSFGYSSIAEFIKDAIREKLQKNAEAALI